MSWIKPIWVQIKAKLLGFLWTFKYYYARHWSAFQIFAFSRNGPHWKDYFWDNITTVAVEDGFDPQMMCHAHSKGVRIVA